jgi:hypothetical protein
LLAHRAVLHDGDALRTIERHVEQRHGSNCFRQGLFAVQARLPNPCAWGQREKTVAQ